jgi:hypothetical protein
LAEDGERAVGDGLRHELQQLFPRLVVLELDESQLVAERRAEDLGPAPRADGLWAGERVGPARVAVAGEGGRGDLRDVSRGSTAGSAMSA